MATSSEERNIFEEARRYNNERIASETFPTKACRPFGFRLDKPHEIGYVRNNTKEGTEDE